MSDTSYDLVIVGAGFAGMYMLHRARGLGLRTCVLEQGGGVGGTWYWNRYPGARCDIESVQYSYQFSEELQQEWDWSERYSSQPEILDYANHVADRFDLRRDICFNSEVTSLAFDDHANAWQIDTTNGPTRHATWVVMATGCLSVPNLPPIEGLTSFEGPIYQTGSWPHY
ncbi:MAG: NAD(P)/FAD-dependent oxidoreductase, partial [Pseudomonadota bacterium]